MGKRANSSSLSDVSAKSRVEVIMEDLSTHPLCPHGPTLLFCSGAGNEFYACASCRGGECSVRIAREAWADPRVQRNNRKFRDLPLKLDKNKSWTQLQKLHGQAGYCMTCDEVFGANSHAHATHHTVSPLTPAQLRAPSAWLPPLDRNTREAQYIFSQHSIDTIVKFVRSSRIKNVVCMGTPSIYEALQCCGDVTSILLDLDTRHRHFCRPDTFLWYNMFNHHFFSGEDELIFEKFLQKSFGDSSICIVLDPPFGGRVEPIAHTLNRISVQYYQCGSNEPEAALVPVVWVFPYFSEPYITNLLPSLRMHDYQVTYTNHAKFKHKPGSSNVPVRLFSNLPLGSLDLAGEAGYRWCGACDKWVARHNAHCDKCGACTSKTRVAYTHCDACQRCVKPTYVHCDTCARCCLPTHACGLTPHVQSCYNCNQKGHKRIDCPLLRKTQSEVPIRKKKRKAKKKMIQQQ